MKILIYYIKIKNLNSYPILALQSILSVLFLQFRSLFENSFSVYGVDLLILVNIIFSNSKRVWKVRKLRKKIFIWCSNLQGNNGEGVLATKFIADLKKYNKNYIFEIKTLSSS